MAGIYIHIPFCEKKCIYCDFFSVGSSSAGRDCFTEALIREISSRKNEISDEISTLYIGGGTPSLMPDDNLKRILDALRDSFAGRFRPAETTMEVNPGDVTEERSRFWKSAGIDRISMGVQSFVDSELKFLWRRHTSDQAADAFSILRRAGFHNMSLDLIYGIPGQTAESFRFSLDRIISLRPEHISVYSLMYEENTPLTKLRDRGVVKETDEDTSIKMYQALLHGLKSAGYRHYEISNFAFPGFESRHNSSYWTGIPYIGFGPGAHSYDGGYIRRGNPPDIKRYISYFSDSDSLTPFYIKETLNLTELFEEYLLTRMRTQDGIDLSDFIFRFGRESYTHLMRNALPYLKNGILLCDADRLFLSEQGFMISDKVIFDLAV